MAHGNAGRKHDPEWIAKRVASYPKERKQRDMGERLMSKVLIDEASGCWVWQGARFKKEYGGDYGQLRIGTRASSKLVGAHRVSYEHFVGPIPEGLEIDHLCRNTLCICPSHLEPVEHLENMRRKPSRKGIPRDQRTS